ncbi:MAG: hypothetical protein HQM10_20295 [Candidatus Riflebacteria bacterium]|nr:hypothetical protein [Candidatus Riflebacteria bacterium]
MRNHLKLTFYFSVLSIFICSILFIINGCSGGGSSSSTSNGLGNDPIEQEINVLLNDFFNKISRKSNDEALAIISDSLLYYRSGYRNSFSKNKFKDTLNTFTGSCSSITAILSETSVIPFSENYVRVRGLLTTNFASDISSKTSVVEFCDIEIERISSWQIKLFSGKDFSGINFPPELQ